MKRPRVLLADDHKLFLAGLQKLLDPLYDVVGKVSDGMELLSAVRKLRPDIAIVDISMPKLNGIQALHKLKKGDSTIKIILLTMHREVAFAAEAFREGASGYVLKDAEPDELLRAIHEVAQGRFYLTPLITRETISDLITTRGGAASPLTPRQQEVLQLLSDGCKLKEIAAQLNISISTVEFHKAEIMRRLGITSTADLIRYSISQGMVSSR